MTDRSTDGVTLWWELVGAGPSVVLIPGRGDSSDLYPVVFSDRLVGAGFSVLRFDPRNTGRSDDGGDTDTLSTMADDVVAVLDAAGVGNAHAMGISMGGMLLVDLASRRPSRILSQVYLSAMSPDPDAGFGDDFFADPVVDPVDATLRAMGAPDADDRAWVEQEVARAARRAPARRAAVQRHQEAAFRGGWPEPGRLGDIGGPALVIHGTADRVLPVAHAVSLHHGIDGSDLRVLDGMGHLPTAREWDLVGDLVVDHCRRAD